MDSVEEIHRAINFNLVLENWKICNEKIFNSKYTPKNNKQYDYYNVKCGEIFGQFYLTFIIVVRKTFVK